ncbi:MAG: RNA polymerase sigma factor [Terriglobales bacterium]|jgi:RNA polymerase sigma-70 factor (ECF subfamily)
MAASDIPESGSLSDSGETTSADNPLSAETQLSSANGVLMDVSSIAIDRGLLDGGASSGGRLDRGLLNFAGSPSNSPVSMANSMVNTDGTLSDVDVMLRVKTGDESAFAYLVQKYRRPMVGFMYRLCHNPSTAEELAQEVFLRVYRSRTTYEPSAKFTTWLYRIATNLAVNHARDNRHERPENTVRLDEPDQETGTTPDLADESLSAEEQILKRERLAAIRSKVNGLPERQRVAVIMHKYQQMDYREIAGVLKLSESATKSLLFRAYETLREQLKEFVSGK